VLGELVGDADFSVGSLLPRARALRISDQAREGLADRSEARTGAVLALCASALVFADRASACGASIRSGRLELSWV
jgi:hypothetical protein